MTRTDSVLLEFDPELNTLSKKKQLRHGLSVVVQVGDTLWVTNDETISLERLTRQRAHANARHAYGQHQQFALHEYLQLPVPPRSDADKKKLEEADLEGLDYHDGYLWLVGSHSLKRDTPEQDDPVDKNIKRLAQVSSDGNRFLLARIPVAETDGMYSLEKEVTQNGKQRTAAQLHGDRNGNDLTEALAQDEHLRNFLSIPGKDNGFDIEGLAVTGERVFIGLRGPVVRGWAVILEVELEVDGPTLKLKPLGRNRQPYRKHFLDLGGLGIRDLCVQHDDLLILAGPTMDLDGPVRIFRWPRGARPNGPSVVFDTLLPIVQEVPFGQGKAQGKDHAEGMTLFSPTHDGPPSILVVYDSVADTRLKERSSVEADIFALS